jgi:hypothetical protein
MNRQHFGDSYDAVKRLWCCLLSEWAPLYADPKFIPQELRCDFERLTRIPTLTEDHRVPFSILNDPDNGIRHPGGKNQRERPTHIRIQSIVQQLRTTNARCVITFDQGFDHNHKQKGCGDKQRQKKMELLRDSGCDGFYYVSHACFLFAASDSRTIKGLWRILEKAGIPEKASDNWAGIEWCYRPDSV